MLNYNLTRSIPTFYSIGGLRSVLLPTKIAIGQRREQSTFIVEDRRTKPQDQTLVTVKAHNQAKSTLQRLPTPTLFRNLLLGTLFTTPKVFGPGFWLFKKIANSRSPLLNADLNPLLRAFIKPIVYDQFCAGRDEKEISQTRDTIKGIGYSGIILCYGREIVVSTSNELRATGSGNAKGNAEIEQWKMGNLKTLDMIGNGDWLGVKFTGAGREVTDALMRQETPCSAFRDAIDAICLKAKERGCRIWIDAEQQILQTTIDSWTVDLMRKYNTDGKALVYNTLQSYLKDSRTKLKAQLALAGKEHWTLAVKLVRGAYIGNDHRDGIHDTKEDTDDSYNGIVHDILTASNLGDFGQQFPKTELFIAGHNPKSVDAAMKLVSSLHEQGRLRTIPDFGQLQGMADELGCRLLERCEQLRLENECEGKNVIVPQAYKCLTWGSVQECMQYLVRRVVENSGGTDRMHDGLLAYRTELRRRIFGL